MPFTEFHVTIYTFTGSYSGWCIIELDLDFLVTFSNLSFTKLKIGEWQSDVLLWTMIVYEWIALLENLSAPLNFTIVRMMQKNNLLVLWIWGLTNLMFFGKIFGFKSAVIFYVFRLLFKTNVLEFGMPSVRERIEDG